jgi:hypothetical protein
MWAVLPVAGTIWWSWVIGGWSGVRWHKEDGLLFEPERFALSPAEPQPIAGAERRILGLFREFVATLRHADMQLATDAPDDEYKKWCDRAWHIQDTLIAERAEGLVGLA